ncbi:manganese-dependent ADP-ribose/CDP-alcohol diphosphatase-like isoform 2-T2 [Discoglossus pictus]
MQPPELSVTQQIGLRLREAYTASMAEEISESEDGDQLLQPYFSFGVIADIQYADRNDGISGWKTKRYYRQSHLHLRNAIQEWNKEKVVPFFILQLGDIIDGSNRKLLTSEASLQKILKETENMKAPFHHIWGNHELYNFDQAYLRESRLNTTHLEDKIFCEPNFCLHKNKDSKDFYAYHFSPYPNFRCIIVDTYDLSILGKEASSPKLEESLNFLDNFNERHMQEFNGGISKDQLSWLQNVLMFSDEHNEKVIIAGHVPIHPKAKPSPCLAWNYTEILDVIQPHPSVVCYLAGHDHSGGYYKDSHGIHHVTMEGIIESPPELNAFATVYVYNDRMVLRGSGRVKSRVLHYRK